MSNIKDLFVSYEIAKQLKDKGFNEVCLGWFQFENYGTEVHTDKYWKEKLSGLDAEEFLNAPLYQQVVDWFREKKDIQINIVWNKFYPNTPYEFEMRPTWRGEVLRPYGLSGMSATYYEALTRAIEEAIKLI